MQTKASVQSTAQKLSMKEVERTWKKLDIEFWILHVPLI